MKLAERTKGRRSPGCAASQANAKAFAADLRPTIAALRADGKTLQAIANILNERGIRTRLGGQWHRESVRAVMLGRAGTLAKHPAHAAITAKAAARRAELAPLVRRLRRAGLTFEEVAEELTRRGVPTDRGGRWHDNTVRRLLK